MQSVGREITIPPIDATCVILDNGITVILKDIHHAPIVSLQVYLKAGSIHEGKYLGTGISHFIEHVIDDGTARRTREEIDDLVEAMGNASNAYTAKDHCQYEITTSVAYADLALDVLADYLTRPTFPPEEIETQRGVICNELNGDLDEPTQLLHDLYHETAFRQHPVRYPVGGYKARFVELTRDDLVTYYQQHYVSENIICVATGDFHPDEMLDKIAAAFQHVPRGIAPPVVLPEEPPQLSPRRTEQHLGVEMAYFALGYHTVGVAHQDAVALDLLAILLSDGESARLVQTLKHKQQLALNVQAWSDTPGYAAGCFGVEAEIEPRKLERAEGAILGELDRLRNEPVAEAALARAKIIESSEHLFMLQSIEEQGAMLGTDELMTGDCCFHEQYLKRVLEVTPQDLQRVARTYLRPENCTTVVIQPKPAGRSKVKRPAHVSIETPVRKTVLSNGVRLLTKSVNTAPIVSIQAMFLGGTRFETEADNGLFYLTTHLLLKGTQNRTATALFDELEAKGGSINAISGHKACGLSLNLLRPDLEYGLTVLADVLLNPTFDTAELEKLKAETITAIQAEADDWYALGKRRFLETMFQVHPVRLRPAGSLASLEKLQRPAVVDCYSRYFVPNNMALGVFGDVEPGHVELLAKERLGQAEPAALDFPAVPLEPPLTSIRRTEHHKPLAQATVFQGYPGVPLQHSDREIVEVLSSVLFGAGQPGGRLYKRLRNEKLVYHIHGYPSFHLEHGYLVLYASTAPQQVERLLKSIDQEILDIQCNGISAAELARAKQMCLMNHLLGAQAVSTQAATAVLDELYGLGYEYTSRQYVRKVTDVTSTALQRAANAYLPLNKRVISIVRGSRKRK